MPSRSGLLSIKSADDPAILENQHMGTRRQKGEGQRGEEGDRVWNSLALN
ncbi:hypothetical protein ACSS6W_009192 [Trichoderma asperelloides]